jgi:hypothetical protein
MTDPLSATAAAAGFMVLAGQIANGIVKLHSFYNTVKSAPKQVSEILDAMQGVQGALEATGEMLNSGNPGSDLARRSTQACLAQCKRLQESLDEKLRKLEKRFQKCRANQVLMAFHQVEIEGTLKDLERCKSSLILCQQVFSTSVQAFNNTDRGAQQGHILNEQRQIRSSMHFP